MTALPLGVGTSKGETHVSIILRVAPRAGVLQCEAVVSRSSHNACTHDVAHGEVMAKRLRRDTFGWIAMVHRALHSAPRGAIRHAGKRDVAHRPTPTRRNGSGFGARSLGGVLRSARETVYN